jgi:hypothetical protein
MSLLRAVKEERAALLVLAGRQLLKASEALLHEVKVPLLLLGDGPEESFVARVG